MYETTLGMRSLESDLKETLADGSYSNFSDYRFIEPQYDYQTIAYAINLQNTEIVDFELYDHLQSLFVEIKKIEHAERLLTETSRRYKSIPSKLSSESASFAIIDSENRDNFIRFVTLIGDRAGISGRIATASTLAMPIVNSRLGTGKVRAIEKELLIENMGRASSEDEAVALGQRFFPNFSAQEIRQFYRQSKTGNEDN